MNEQQMRADFERWISAPPFEHMCDRHPNDTGASPWPGMYKRYETEIAWEAWQAALRASGERMSIGHDDLSWDAGLRTLVEDWHRIADERQAEIDRLKTQISGECNPSRPCDTARELAEALRDLIDRYVQAIGNEGIECYKARAALARYEAQS